MFPYKKHKHNTKQKDLVLCAECVDTVWYSAMGSCRCWKSVFSSTSLTFIEEKIIKSFKIHKLFEIRQSLNHKWLKARREFRGTILTLFLLIILPRQLVLSKHNTEVDRPLV